MSLGPLMGDLRGGFTTALTMLPVLGSYGVIALAPLGPESAALGFMLGVFGAVVSNLVAVLAGARGPLLCGPSASMAMLVPPLLVALLDRPGFRLPDGQPDVPLLMAAVAAGTLLTGVTQWTAGRLRLGSIVSYVPYPVHAGFMNAVAVLMTLAVLPYALGLPPDRGLGAAGQGPWLATVVTLVALAIAVRPPAWTRAVPPYLLALAVATGLHHALKAAFGAAAVGSEFGALGFQGLAAPRLFALRDAQDLQALAAAAPVVLQFALAVTVTSTIQTMLAASTLDGMTGQRQDGERLLYGQGAGNMAAAVAGMLPTAGSVSLGAVNVLTGGRGTASRALFGLFLGLLFAFGSAVLSRLPMAAIAGLFIAAAWALVDPWSRQASLDLLRSAGRGRRPSRQLLVSWIVMALVVAVSLASSLIVGVGFGVALATLLFLRASLRSPVRATTNATERGSRRIRSPAAAERLRQHGQRIVLVELDGPLFFGTADAAARVLERVAAQAEHVVLDFERVRTIDASGARVLAQTALRLRRAGQRLRLSSLPAGDERRAALLAMDVGRAVAPDDFFPDADRALEDAEDALLAQVDPQAAAGTTLGLAQTLLGEGLAADDLSVLEALLETRALAAGEAVFRRGDPGDALYLLLAGRVGIWLSGEDGADGGAGRRLVSYAPGVAFGEMGLLGGESRSADAIAEEPALVLRLHRSAYERLAREHPVLHGRLLLRLNLHLASRVRALTRELEALSRQ